MQSGYPAKQGIGCVVIFLNSPDMDQDLHTKKNKIWGVIVNIINGRVTRKKLGDRSHHSYFMVYSDTTGVIIYWEKYHSIFIHKYHSVWFDEYNSRLSI